MHHSTSLQPSRYTPPASAVAPAEDRAQELADALNATIREIHASGKVVQLPSVELCRTGEHPLPQIRVDVRDPENVESRPEVCDA